MRREESGGELERREVKIEIGRGDHDAKMEKENYIKKKKNHFHYTLLNEKNDGVQNFEKPKT